MAKKKSSKRAPGSGKSKSAGLDDTVAAEKRRAIHAMWKKRLEKAHSVQLPWWTAGQRMHKFIEGDQWVDSEDLITPDLKWSVTTNNRMWPLVQGYLSTLVHQRPNVTAKPVHDGEAARQRAKVNSKFMNYVLRETRYEEHTRNTVRDAITYGVGFKEQTIDRERGDIPTSRWVSAEDVLVDPNANTVISSVGWIARKYTLQPSKGLGEDGGGTDKKVSTGKKASEHIGGGDEDEMITLYRIYMRGDDPTEDDDAQPNSKNNKSSSKGSDGEVDPIRSAVQKHIEKSGNRVITLSIDHPELLDERPWPFVLDHDEFPITPFRVHSVPGAFLTHSVLKPLVPLQKQLNWATTFLITRMRNSSQRKWVIDKSRFQGGEEEIEKLTSRNDDEVIKTAGRMQDAVYPLEMDALPTSILQMLPILQDQFDAISGFQELFGPMKSARSATEADIRDQRAQTNSALMLQSIEVGMLEDIRHMMQMAFSFTPLKRLMKIVGPEELVAETDPLTGQIATIYWNLDMTPEEIRSEVDILLEPGSTRRVNRDQEVNDRVNIMDRKSGYMKTIFDYLAAGLIKDEAGLQAILDSFNADLEDIAEKLGWANTSRARIPAAAFNITPPPDNSSQSFTIKEGDISLSIDEPNPSLSIDQPNPSLSIDQPNLSIDQPNLSVDQSTRTSTSGGASGTSSE